MAVAGSEGDAAKGGEGRSDVSGSDGLKIFTGLNAIAHQKNRDVLVVIIGRAVASAVGAGFSQGRAVHEPVGLGNDEQVAAAAGKITVGHSAAGGTLRGGTVAQLFGPVDLGDAGDASNGVEKRFHGVRISGQLFVNAFGKVDVATGDPRNGGFIAVEAL